MRRLFSLFLVVVMVLAMGGASALASEGGYDLTMWLFQDWTVGRAAEIWNEWAEGYIAQNPSVKSITFIGKPDTEIVSGFLAGSGLPDMFAIQFLNGKRIVENAKILNFQPYYDAASEDWKSAQNPAAMRDLMSNPEGVCWGVPFTANVQLLFRNTAVLKACGIDPDKYPQTIDELLEQFEIIKQHGYDVLPNLTANEWITATFVAGNPDLKIGWEDGQTTITAEALTPGYEILKKVGQYAAPYTFLDQAATDAFTGNKLAFTLFGPFYNPNLEAAAKANADFTYDAIPCPSQVAGGPYSAAYGNEWCGGVDSGDQGRNDAIAGFLAYITEADQMETFCRDMARPVMNVTAMQRVTGSADAPWMLVVCNQIISNCVNQAVPFRCDQMWETGLADDMYGLFDGSIADAAAAAANSVSVVNENQ
ncbi:MAG: hypothetical protein LBU67_02670 [Oscillospiraceae bacterium]|jgi:multiple sugar transport system substrate-binding protein|nr:hypothetical protein [Oscillospiraceae bacterium]